MVIWSGLPFDVIHAFAVYFFFVARRKNFIDDHRSSDVNGSTNSGRSIRKAKTLIRAPFEDVPLETAELVFNLEKDPEKNGDLESNRNGEY